MFVTVMQLQPADASRSLVLVIGPVHIVKEPQRLRYPVAQVRAVTLEWHIAANVDGVQIKGRQTIPHPGREHLSNPAGRLDTD